MASKLTSDAQARSPDASSAKPSGYIGRDDKFIGNLVAEQPPFGSASTVEQERSEQSTATDGNTNTAASPPGSPDAIPEDPRELISMAFTANVSALAPNLYLGNLQVARSTRYRTEHRITHIVSVCTDAVPADWPESGQSQLRIPVQDLDHEDLLIWMPIACRFIEQSLQEGGTVLIHSERGQSRSATIATAYFMYKNGIGASEALELVRKAREQIWVKPGFHEQLVIFGLCQYNPNPQDAIYRNWRTRVDHALARVQKHTRQ